MNKDKYIGVRVTDEVYDHFKKLSEENQSSVASEVRKVLFHYVRDLNKVGEVKNGRGSLQVR